MKFSNITALAFLLGAMTALASPLSGTGATDNALTQAHHDDPNAFSIRSADIETAEPVASPDIIDLKPAAGELSSNTNNGASAALDVEDKDSNCSIYCNLFAHIIRCLQSPTFCRCDSRGYVHCEGPSKSTLMIMKRPVSLGGPLMLRASIMKLACLRRVVSTQKQKPPECWHGPRELLLLKMLGQLAQGWKKQRSEYT
ncbi:hypothetical protein HYQ44_017266 [Verticillium longisporum]|nr:hypothetical protein HYQ44_017266 [Verticillium longisporum]